MPTPTEKKLSAAAIARDWNCHRTYASKCIKHGCPTDSFENARLWREANAMSRAPTHSKAQKELLEEKDNDSPEARARRKKFFEDKPEGAKLPSDRSLDDALFSAIEASDEAKRLLREAMIEGKHSKISPLLSIHNKALEARFNAERLYREELERRQILIPLQVANDNARKGFEVIIARLAAHPQNCAPRCNPADPHRAMAILEEAVAGIMAAAHKAFAPGPV